DGAFRGAAEPAPHDAQRDAGHQPAGQHCRLCPEPADGQLAMRWLLAATLVLSWSGASLAQEPDKLVEQGKLLAMTFCAQCHAIGTTDASPHAQAPAFRTVDRRVDLDTFFQRLREGVTSGHSDMPTIRFTREDARAFIAYLRSIQR